MLSPAELYAKWDHILAGACRYLRQIPDEGLTLTPPDRPRTLRDLGYHVVSIARVFIHAYDEGERESWRGIGGTTPEALLSGADLADYGEETRRLLAEWWRDAGSQDPLDRVLETYWGAHNLHECLERETWHTGQHTRQVMMFLEGMDIPPDRPLTAEDLAGLPMPSGVWD
ncbi:MAG: DinB family protein [Dehalococcoidia bacterium]